MTKRECEKTIAEMLKAIKAVYEMYMQGEGVEDDYLILTMRKDHIAFNNSYWEHVKGQIDYYEERH